MRITFITIFPDSIVSFINTSLIKRAIQDEYLTVVTINPRDFCLDAHRQVDDEIYGGGPGLLLKAKPFIDAICNARGGKSASSVHKSNKNTRIVFVKPAPTIFDQPVAHELAGLDHIIFVCGRYEGIDARVEQYCYKFFSDCTMSLSIGPFITMGGERPAMTMTEAIVRLVPGVLSDISSTYTESYSVRCSDDYIEYPQYTRPAVVYNMEVPTVLRNGNHAAIDEWQHKMKHSLSNK